MAWGKESQQELSISCRVSSLSPPCVTAPHQDSGLVSPSWDDVGRLGVTQGWASDGGPGMRSWVRRAAFSLDPVMLLLPDTLSAGLSLQLSFVLHLLPVKKSGHCSEQL